MIPDFGMEDASSILIDTFWSERKTEADNTSSKVSWRVPIGVYAGIGTWITPTQAFYVYSAIAKTRRAGRLGVLR